MSTFVIKAIGISKVTEDECAEKQKKGGGELG